MTPIGRHLAIQYGKREIMCSSKIPITVLDCFNLCCSKIAWGVWGAGQGLAVVPRDKWDRRQDLTGVREGD